MRQSIPKPAIAAILALLAIVLVAAFLKAGGGSAPQVDPSTTPDYSKMTPEQIAKAHNSESGNGPSASRAERTAGLDGDQSRP